jgi:hypothetical protein
MTSKHSSSNRLLSTCLFDGLNSFDAIEARISALPGNKERGDAFEMFAEAYLATQKIAQAKEVWPIRGDTAGDITCMRQTDILGHC